MVALGIKGFAISVAVMALTIPAMGGTIILNDVVDPNGSPTFSGDGISVALTDGTSADGLSWTGAGAEAFTLFTPQDLSFFGTFTCAGLCSDTFEVDFIGAGFLPGATANLSIFGTSTGSSIVFDGFTNSNQSLGSVFQNGSGEFSMASTPILLTNPGNFSASVFFHVDMGEGTVSLPEASSADLFVNDGSAVPEPGTIAILAACILLLIYLKRLRKA